MCAFRVLQFNMQFGQNWSDTDPDAAPVDLDLTISEIRSHDADFVFLQEVEQARPGGVQIDPPPNLARLRAALPDYDSFFSYPKPDPRELPFGIGLAILSRFPLSERIRRDLPSPAVEFNFRGERRTPTDRVLIGAKTVIAGRELQLFNTHLLAFFMLRTSSEEHPSQRQFVVDQVRTAPGCSAAISMSVATARSWPSLVRLDFRACKPVCPPGAGDPTCSTISSTIGS
jgi:endonuclease/exonuclease/phosphatase family metal-dependent hydrolase